MGNKPVPDVRSVNGLQNMLTDAVVGLNDLERRDLPWVRLAVSSVNSGNSLLRTQIKIDEMQHRQEVLAAKSTAAQA